MCLVTVLLPTTGLPSKAVEEFYAALYDEVALETDDGDILNQDAIGGSINT